MRPESPAEAQIRRRALRALREALCRAAPAVEVDEGGYVRDARDNLVPAVALADFESDLRAGDGNELETKFRAAHSSSALAVNSFAPFRRHPSDLRLLGAHGFDRLRFEAKCPTGLRGGRAPNLDVLVTGPRGIVGVESKLTEYLNPHRAEFSTAYREQIRDERRQEPWFQEMLRLMDEPQAYRWLDAAQLIKHAFGLARLAAGQPVTLLYLYWEPLNPQPGSIFDAHRAEIAAFVQRIAGAAPAFEAMSYAMLWTEWEAGAPDWLSEHVAALRARYAVAL